MARAHYASDACLGSKADFALQQSGTHPHLAVGTAPVQVMQDIGIVSVNIPCHALTGGPLAPRSSDIVTP